MEKSEAHQLYLEHSLILRTYRFLRILFVINVHPELTPERYYLPLGALLIKHFAHQDATSIQALVRFVQEFLFKVSATHTTLLPKVHYILSTLPH